MIGEVLGREIEARSVDIDSWLASAGLPQHGYQRDARAKMYSYYDAHGLTANPLMLRTILGREPRSLRDFFSELARGGPDSLAPDAAAAGAAEPGPVAST